VIEDHPLTVEVGEWVTRQALSQSQTWRALGLNLPVSINVSARQIQQRDFVARLQTILAEFPGVQPGSLELEILETSALEDVEVVSNVIKACRTLGVNFALDDFGTGYSSLTYLKRLPVTLIKIDQSFVSDMLDDQDNLLILQGVIDLAKTFHREVMAEGVETVAHGTALLHMGCELAQGYGIARPMPAHEMAHWVNTWVVDPAWLEARPIYANTP
jgi:EAL domain-containing protein (putative c-di-GMP-specific phosphodiesterase class I)